MCIVEWEERFYCPWILELFQLSRDHHIFDETPVYCVNTFQSGIIAHRQLIKNIKYRSKSKCSIFWVRMEFFRAPELWIRQINRKSVILFDFDPARLQSSWKMLTKIDIQGRICLFTRHTLLNHMESHFFVVPLCSLCSLCLYCYVRVQLVTRVRSHPYSHVTQEKTVSVRFGLNGNSSEPKLIGI